MLCKGTYCISFFVCLCCVVYGTSLNTCGSLSTFRLFSSNKLVVERDNNFMKLLYGWLIDYTCTFECKISSKNVLAMYVLPNRKRSTALHMFVYCENGINSTFSFNRLWVRHIFSDLCFNDFAVSSFECTQFRLSWFVFFLFNFRLLLYWLTSV